MDNVQGAVESPLLILGGVVSEVNDPSLPQGSAAVATDCDFTVASVKTRDGIQNVFSYQGNDQLKIASAGSSLVIVGETLPAWTSPNNIAANTPGTYATTQLNFMGGASESQFLAAQAFPFSIPLNSQVVGAEVIVNGKTPVGVTGWSLVGNYAGSPNQVATVAYNGNTTLGSLLICYTLQFGGGGPSSLTDTIGNTWVLAGAFFGVNGFNVDYAGLWYCVNIGSGANTVTAHGISGSFYGEIVAEFLGNASHQGSVLDNPSVTFASSQTGTLMQPPPSTTSGPNELVIGAFYPTGNSASANAPWQTNATLLETGFGIVFQLGLPQGTYTPNVTQSSSGGSGYGALAAAFFPSNAAVGGGQASIAVSPLTVTDSPFESAPQLLPTSDGSLTFGAPNFMFGQHWTPAQVNSPSFGFGLQAIAPDSSTVTIADISGVEAIIWYTPPGLTQFDHVTSFEMTDGDIFTLALDNNGVLWQEDVFGNPNVLTPIYTAIEPKTFAVSITEDDREFFAFSNLQNGTDMPRDYDGTNIDRISQVGPGAPPTVSSSGSSYSIVSITQPASHIILGAQWNAGINSNSPGSTLTIYDNHDPNFLQGVMVGSVIYLQFSDVNFTAADGTYIVTAVGQATGMESGGGSVFNYISMTAPSVKFARSFNNTTPPGVGTMQLTIATITLSTPVPNLSIGGSITLSGNTPSAWNGTWTVNGLVNGAILKITQTSLVSNTATYQFNLISGVTPTPGQFVTVTGCTNGPVVNGQSIFDVFQGSINSASPGQFTIFPVNSANIPPAAETTAVGQVLGTEFTFDPGLGLVGTASNPIFGNAGSGGTLVIAGGLGAGTRKAVVMFLTRNQYMTAPSPPITFELTASANQITATGIPIGPPNVIARVLAFTGANGDFYFWLPKAQQIIGAGGQVINYTSTVVNDNISTEATFNFTDALLLAGSGIDDQGANQFALVELGSSTGVITYADRLFAWGEQNKVQNFINWSFDGGYIAQASTTPLQPLGWTIDPVNGAGGSLIVSPLFGNAYQISNTSGSTKAIYGMITQTAFQDVNMVPIINVQTTYSVRVTAENPTNTVSGQIVVDLFSPSFGASFGSYVLPIATLGAGMSINIGTLLTTVFQTTVPADLLLRLYVTSFPNNATVVIDRIEPFPTEQPVLTTQLRASYPENFEAFDGVTGNLGVGIQNQQPVRNAYELFDNLYVVKTKSIVSTLDNGTTEPDLWNVRTVSNKCGTPSIHGVDVGEGWAIIVGESGLYIFIGGEPVKISPELDGLGPASSGTSAPGLWQSISWKYGYTVWVRCDTEQRKIFIGVPIPTPNKWMPLFPANANPTQPNVVLCLNFKELMTGGELQAQGPIRLSYTGELKSWPIGRKWSAWSIQACYADFIDRQTQIGLDAPLFFCGDTGTGKIYQQIAGVYNDDGAPMHCQYITYGFPKVSEAMQSGLGVNQMQADLMTLTMIGAGEARFTIYPNSTDSPDQEELYPEPLIDPSPAGDLEIPLNQIGNRFFLGFRVRDANEWFELSKVAVALTVSPWAPVRGSNN